MIENNILQEKVARQMIKNNVVQEIICVQNKENHYFLIFKLKINDNKANKKAQFILASQRKKKRIFISLDTLIKLIKDLKFKKQIILKLFY